MTVRLTLSAIVLAFGPAMAFAGSCPFGEHQAQSCAPGTAWDADTQTCVEQVSS